MRKNAAWLLIACFLIASIATVPLTVKAQPKTITVPNDSPSIQQAINQANAGDTVYVKAGYYNGSIEITKPITLLGEDNRAIINDWYINGKAAILIKSHNVTISGITIDNPSGTTSWNKKRGIHLLGASNCTIQGNIVRDCNGEGIWLYQSTNNQVINNTVESSDTCISIGESSSNHVINNTIQGNYLGIYAYYNTNDNVFIGNNLYGTGINLRSGAARNTFIANTLTKAGLAIGDYYDNYVNANNTFYHNSFISSETSKPIQNYDFSGTNRFDNGQEGNYYSDYQGEDLNGDGLGDTPYVMVTSGADIVDPYPLIAPWSGNNLLPVIHILSPAKDGTFNTADVALSFNLSRAAQEIKYSIDGSANTTITGNVTLPNLSSGNHTLTLYATSPTGAEAQPQTVTFTVDLPLIPNTALVWVAIAVFLAVAIAIVAILLVSRRINR